MSKNLKLTQILKNALRNFSALRLSTPHSLNTKGDKHLIIKIVHGDDDKTVVTYKSFKAIVLKGDLKFSQLK
jgi:hypothetical protein